MFQILVADGAYTLAPVNNFTNVYVSGEFSTADAYLAYRKCSG